MELLAETQALSPAWAPSNPLVEKPAKPSFSTFADLCMLGEDFCLAAEARSGRAACPQSFRSV
jgi:hypothetical protein